MFKILSITLLFLWPAATIAQTGILKGIVTDQETGEEMLGCNIFLKQNATVGTISDLFGNYQLTLPADTYSIACKFMGYTALTIEDIIIIEGETTEINIPMGKSEIGLKEFVMTAKRITDTEMANLTERKKAYIVKDGISSQEISRSGASDASQAVKQISGASVEDGKYMVVRGLGDRYSITQLNGVTLPSTDPYRNSASLDLIPSFMLDNIMTSKTFSPDQPGNFTGGNMNIKTKSYPEKFFVNFNLSTSYNTLSSFRNDFITSTEGKEIPEYLKDESNRHYLSPTGFILARQAALKGDMAPIESINRAANDLNTPLLGTTTNSVLDYGVGASIGNMIKIKDKNPLGYVFGLKYKRGYDYYDQGAYNRWEAVKDGMNYKFDMSDEKGTINDNLGAYVSFSYQFKKNHQIALSGLLNKDKDNFAREQFGLSEQVGGTHQYRARSMGEKKRTMANTQLTGTHKVPTLKDAKIEWMIGYTHSSQLEPDLRFFSDHVGFVYDEKEGNEVVRMDLSSYGLPSHFYRDLTDEKIDIKVDYKQPFGQRKGSHLKFGGLYSIKDREFNEYRFKIAKEPKPIDGMEADYSDYLSDFGIMLESPYTASNYYTDDSRKTNLYVGDEDIWAAYGMVVHSLTSKLKAVAGARVEGTNISVKSAEENLRAGKINAVDVLPSLNLIYALNPKSNLRFSASQTIARPNMREMAPFFSFDFLGGFLYSGNDSLQRTKITNLDLRWELFARPGEMFAVSAYFKHFKDPIAKVFSPVSSTGEITFENLNAAQVYGIELEWRKSLSFVHERLKNFRFAANVSYIYSQMEIPEADLAAAEANYLEINEKRPFQGQSPYLINFNLYYQQDSIGLSSSLTFNMFGKRLFEIGSTGNPDIYEMPRPLLNYNITKKIKKNIDVTLGIGNILGSKFLTQQFYKSKNPTTGEVVEQEYKVQEYELGRTISLGISYKFK